MIITDLQAENFRKYQNLHLENLPTKGLIAVNGNNESGKSSIGDAICFALFGRTDKLTGERIGKLVRWGEESVKITLAFSHKNKQYRLTRMADISGVQTASLWSVDEGRTLADSTEEVAETVRQILGYGYPAFIRTFYWSQKVNEDGQADTDSLQAMAGVKTYIKLDEELRKEQVDDVRLKDELTEKLEAANTELKKIDVDPDYLTELVNVRDTLEDRRLGSQALTQNIGEVRESYTENHGLFHRINRQSRKLGWLGTLGIILLILALLGWAIITFMPELLAPVWPVDAENQEMIGRNLLWGAVAIAILTSLLMLYGWHVERNRIRPLREQSIVLASALKDGSEQLNSSVGSFIGDKAEKYLSQRELLSDDDTDLKKWQSDPARLQFLSEKIRTYEADPLDTIAAADGVSMVLEDQNKLLNTYLSAVDEDVETERLRVDQYTTFKNEAQTCEEQLAAHEHKMLLKKKGLAMVHRASRHSIQNFNKIVHSRCSDLLSEFTQSNYKSLEIDNNFMPRVLSEEKGDYLEFEEISAGTQRQIALAMRMSLANTLATSTDANGQFIFLDEPFAFFDPERTTSTINSLTSATSGSLNQAWVTVQDIPVNLNTAFTIDCRQKTPNLHVTGQG
ncbi:MAG: ATP-binding protein [Thiolinea sp.]